MLQVHYSSGYNRYIFPDNWGNYETNMTQSQYDFMNNSIKMEMLDVGPWNKTYYYWLNKDKPNKAIMSQIRIRNQLYGNC